MKASTTAYGFALVWLSIGIMATVQFEIPAWVGAVIGIPALIWMGRALKKVDDG